MTSLFQVVRERSPYALNPEQETALARIEMLLYEVIREVRAGDPNVHQHADLQRLHRKVIEALGEDEPGEFVRPDYWLGRFPRV